MCSRAFETRSLPSSLATTHRGFAFYLAFPRSSIRPLGFTHLCRSRPRGSIRSLLLPFPIEVPGFLGTLAALGTSRRRVNSHQRLVTLSSMSLTPSAQLKLSRYPRFFTATLAALPSISEIPFLDCKATTLQHLGG
jgi:hypothetical protein